MLKSTQYKIPEQESSTAIVARLYIQLSLVAFIAPMQRSTPSDQAPDNEQLRR
eukprot:m.1110512 g.1110512  ORF g.1110512 m.1110512 type:complete len:53 (+) comp24357_c0_seq3:119-277(+)